MVAVIRDEQTVEIPYGELVIGDLIILTNKQIMPADVRILKIESEEIIIDNSIYTGNTQYIKLKDEQSPVDIFYLDANNMI